VDSVLIVDDESGIRKLLRRWLSTEGYDIREAPDAETALDEMAKAPADVVMCDVDMPGHGGLWLAAQLRQQFPTTAIVLATALDSVPPVTSMQRGIVKYLVKPFARHRVVEAVSFGVQWHLLALNQADGTSAGDDRLTKWLESIED
jgi:DNA-binding NtrC family response regulator